MTRLRAEPRASALERILARRRASLVRLGASQKTTAELLEDAERIRTALPPAAPGSHVLLVIKRDRYAAAAALLGALGAGHAVALAPDGRRESVMAAHGRPEVVALLHDTGAGLPLRVEQLLEANGPAPAVASWSPPSGVWLTRYAWGADGALVARSVDAAGLMEELTQMEARVSGGARVVGSAGPGEPVGLSSTVLLPLVMGGAFAGAPEGDPARLAEQARALDADLVVASRRVLRGLARLPNGSLPAGATVVTPRQLFPSEREDQAEALEDALCGHEGVEDAAVVLVGEAVYAVVVADDDVSSAALETTLGGRRVSLRRSHAIPRFEDGSVDAARLLRPFGLSATGAPLCFTLELGPTALREEGGVVAERVVGIPTHYGWFEGHFTGYPILAGAVQLKELVLPFVREVFPRLGPVRAMTRIKFTGRILPGDHVTVRLVGGEGSVAFAIDKGGVSCASGQLGFGASA